MSFILFQFLVMIFINSKELLQKSVSNIWSFVFRICFGFRISTFEFFGLCCFFSGSTGVQKEVLTTFWIREVFQERPA